MEGVTGEAPGRPRPKHRGGRDQVIDELSLAGSAPVLSLQGT